MSGPTTTTMTARPLRGLTLVESVMSTLIVSLLIVAALGALGMSQRLQRHGVEGDEAMLLGQDLMSEILGLPYEDPTVPDRLGLETGESNATRADFDDVDDYHLWHAEPAVARDGTRLAGADRFGRRVTVSWADPTTLQRVASPTGVKLIRVEVEVNGRSSTTLTALRTSAWREPMDIQETAP